MESTENFTLPLYISGQSFNDKCNTNLVIKFDNRCIAEKTFVAGNKTDFIINQEVIVEKKTKNNITFTWTGDTESSDKYIKLGKIIVNQQNIKISNGRYKPYKNNYIQTQIEGNDQQKKNIKDKIYFIGNTYGWYGDIKFSYRLGTRCQLINAVDLTDWQKTIGSVDNVIYLDPKEAQHQNVTSN